MKKKHKETLEWLGNDVSELFNQQRKLRRRVEMQNRVLQFVLWFILFLVLFGIYHRSVFGF